VGDAVAGEAIADVVVDIFHEGRVCSFVVDWVLV
jgi:hypothetical protein